MVCFLTENLEISLLCEIRPLPFPWLCAEAVTGTTITGPTATLIAGNGTANISCMAKAGTVETRSWMKDGKPLVASSRVVFSPDKSFVVISPVQKEDNGEFKCEFRNAVSNDGASYKMVVNCEC